MKIFLVRGLHNFKLRPHLRARGAVNPQFNSGSGVHYLAPDDFATIYNLKPLYAAGLNGSGQKIAVVGQTQVNVSDLQLFRNRFNLGTTDPQMVLVPNLPDPGISKDDLAEADLDLEWSSAVGRGASIVYVYSENVTDAVEHVIDQNLAPVLTMSYGLCEVLSGVSDATVYQQWAKQAIAQGISWVASSGDSGGADCVNGTSKPGGLAVDLPAAVPEVTGVGGTEFNEGPASFWVAANDTNGSSAKSYIPETVWNDSLLAGEPAAGGGGASNIFFKPSWQTGPGVPSDNARDVPDVSLAASADHDGYLVYSGGTLQVFGGTSVSAPSFAGMIAVLNQRLAQGGAATAGHLNPNLYKLARSSPQAFHDIVDGDNKVTITCGARSRNCVAGTFGYSAGAGYDLATGLGSVDAANLVDAWVRDIGVVQRQSANISVSSSAASIDSGASVTVTVTVRGPQSATPTGIVTFSVGSTNIGTATLSGSNGVATAALTLAGANFPLGASTISVSYAGDFSYLPGSATVSLSVVSSVTGPISISGFTNAASFKQAYAPGMLLSIFGEDLAPSTWSAQAVPLPRQLAGVSVTIAGVNAPLYFVSRGQLNVQIPYEAAAGSSVAVSVSNNGKVATANIPISAAAPGIFTDANSAPVPGASGARGSAQVLYITGDGALTPSLATGSAPTSGTPVSSLPHSQQSFSLQVGGQTANVFFVGVPPGLVGVTQVNYFIPDTIGTGTQNVVAIVGGIASAPAKLTVK